MPVPLRSLPGEFSIEIGGLPPVSLLARPELASLAMTAIGSFSHVENFQLQAFMQMMGGSADRAARIFIKLESRSAKISAITAVASDLSDELQDILKALLKLTGSQQKRRDKLAHHSWGHIPERDDVLLLRDPRRSDSGADFKEGIFVYTEADFKSMITDFHRIGGHWGRFNHALSGHEELSARRYAQLCQDPEILEILTRLRQQG